MRRFIPVVVLLVLLAHPAAASTNLPLTATATNNSSTFIKYVYSWPLPTAARSFTGLTGSLSITSATDFFGEALVSVGVYPSGSVCPPSGVSFPSYEALAAAYPGSTALAHYILKQSGAGTVSVPTSATLSVGLPISGCIVVVFDGANFAGGSFTMSSAMSLQYSTTAPPASTTTTIDDEFCFNMAVGSGCQMADPRPGISFARVLKVSADTQTVKALYGNLSDAAFITFPLMVGEWSMVNDVYVDAGCRQFGAVGEYVGMFSKPAAAVSLLHSSLSGDGLVSLQQSVSAAPVATVAPADCIVHLVRASGNGAVDAEMQLVLVSQKKASGGCIPFLTC